MRVTVKFFASLKEQFEKPELVLEFSEQQTTVSEIWKQVSQTQELPANVLSAINLEYAQVDDLVKDGDEVAFFPPVTGG